jgi:pyrroloquinoline-quinone synthase
MDKIPELTQIVERWNLLNHPFYQAWTAGTLSVEALQIYAREYGAFIETIPEGWLTLKDPETAQEEREHIELWDAFLKSLGAERGLPQFTETNALTRVAHRLFAQPATALGALYSFEVQQPATASSKLDGLDKWYRLDQGGKEYFKVHSTNWHESEKILAQIYALSEADQHQAIQACALMSESLWDGLTGIHSRTSIN